MKTSLLIFASRYSLLVSVAMPFLACRSAQPGYPSSLLVSVSNACVVAAEEVPVVLSLDAIRAKKPDFNAKACLMLFQQSEIPYQINDLDGDSVADELVFLASLAPAEERIFALVYDPAGERQKKYSRRTQAEISVKVGGEWKDRKYVGGAYQNVDALRVPAEHTDHSGYIRYEGPGWESDKVAYRLYLDWRNAIDIFGKLTGTTVLQNVDQEGMTSYHEPAPWGMDIFKVGESLGVGSIGMWQDGKVHMVSVTDSVACRIVLNGPLQSQIETTYSGWKIGEKTYALTSELSIFAGNRVTRHDLTLDGPPASLCTGLIINESVVVMTNYDKADSPYVYFGTWGTQSLNNDGLGLGLFVNRDDLLTLTEDKWSHVLVFKPGLHKLRYYFAAAWEKEPDGLRSAEEFGSWMETMAKTLSHPPIVAFQ